MSSTLTHRVGSILGIVLFIGALWVLQHKLKAYHLHEILWHMHNLRTRQILLSLLLTGLTYIVLTGYDILSFLSLGQWIGYGRIAATSFIGYCLGHNIGMSVICSGSVRLRMYSSHGVKARDIAHIVTFSGISFWLGFLTVGAISFIARPLPIPPLLKLPFATVEPLGMVFALLILCYIFIAIRNRRQPFRLGNWYVPSVTPAIIPLQIIIGTLEWLCNAGALFVLLPYHSHIHYFFFLEIFLLAQICGILSQVPAGIGVFETVILYLLPSQIPASSLLGSLLVYRVIFYLIPLIVAIALLGRHEFVQKNLERKATGTT